MDGQEILNHGVFLEITPIQKLVFTDTYTEGWSPTEHPFMTAMILFEDLGEGKTKYTALARHRSVDDRIKHEDMGFFTGWNIVIDQLVAYAKTL